MLISADESCLMVIDVQDKLVPAMSNMDPVIENIQILMSAAVKLSVPTLVSEQYSKGLGRTIAALSSLMGGDASEKISFSGMADTGFASRFHNLERRHVVMVGIEAHVCVLQTSMHLLNRGIRVFIVADATASRTVKNHDLALQRLAAAGAIIVSTEMVVFEWLERAGTDEFKELSRLIK